MGHFVAFCIIVIIMWILESCGNDYARNWLGGGCSGMFLVMIVAIALIGCIILHS